MIIFKKSLPRRTFIRGAGVALMLPVLDAMVPALTAQSRTAAKPVRRFGAVYIPNGASVQIQMPDGSVYDRWTPGGGESSLDLSPILQPLSPFRDEITVVSGLGSRPAESWGDSGGDHPRSCAAWLSAVHARRSESEPSVGVTIDQLMANEFAKDTQLRSLNLGVDDFGLVGNCADGYACSYFNTISWRSPTAPVPCQTNPRVVFERMFGRGGAAARRAQLPVNRSILDSVTDEIAGLQYKLGARDRARVAEYLDGVRELEQRIRKIETQQETRVVELPDLPVGVPDLFEDHVKLMLDLQVLAFAADVTRVGTFMLTREGSNRPYSQIGVPDAHHALSHHGNKLESLDKQTRINAYHAQLFGYFLSKLRATQDGDGSLLDHSLILYGSGMSDGNHHSHDPLPLLLAGSAAGRIKGGRHLTYDTNTPMADLLVSAMDVMGVPATEIGDSTGRLPGL